MKPPANATEEDVIYNEVQAAAFIKMSSRTLQAWRSQGCGPDYFRAGRAIRYWRSALIRWTLLNTHHAGVEPQR